MCRRLFRGHQLLPERAVLRLCHRAVDVGGLALAIARGAVGLRHVDGVEAHDGRGRIVEIEAVAARAPRDVLGERPLGQRAARDNRHGIVFQRNLRELFMHDGHVRMACDILRDVVAEAVPVDGERAARRHARRIGSLHDDGAHAAHLLLEHADGVLEPRAAQRIAANEFGETGRLVRGRHLLRAHLVEHHACVALRSLPGGLGAREPRADDDDVLHFFFPSAFFALPAFSAFAAFSAASFALFFARRSRNFSSSSLMGLPSRVLQSSLLQYVSVRPFL